LYEIYYLHLFDNVLRSTKQAGKPVRQHSGKKIFTFVVIWQYILYIMAADRRRRRIFIIFFYFG